MITELFSQTPQAGIVAKLFAAADPGLFEPTAEISLASYIGSLRRALTVKQVAELLSLSSRTVQQWAKVGRLPAIRHGSLTRFDPLALAEWVRDNSTSPAIRTN
jgi:excisionase family DNA binding protein